MKKYFLTGVICLSMLLFGTARSGAETEAGRILSVKKQVHVVQGESRIVAEPQMKLMLKDSVETGEESRTKLLFTDDSIINLGEMSRLVVEEYLYSPEKQRSKSIYRLIDGSLKVVVGRSDLEIHTPTAVAAARGTVIHVKYMQIGGKWYTIIIVTEGESQVTAIIDGKLGKKSVLVKAGEMVLVEWGKDPEDVKDADFEILGGDDWGDIIVVGDYPKGHSEESKTPEELLGEEGPDPGADQEPEVEISPVNVEMEFGYGG